MSEREKFKVLRSVEPVRACKRSLQVQLSFCLSVCLSVDSLGSKYVSRSEVAAAAASDQPVEK